MKPLNLKAAHTAHTMAVLVIHMIMATIMIIVSAFCWSLGQVLARLESPDLAAARDQVKTQLDQAKVELDRAMKLQAQGIQDMATLPDAIFVIDVGYHKIAILEAKKLGIPLIGVVDSNHSPEGIDYIIPGNDDSSKAVTLYARGIADAIIEGRANAVQDVVNAVAAEGADEFVEVQEAAA